MSESNHNPLAEELKTFEDKVAPQKDKEGKYAVVHGSDVLGFFNDYEDAMSAAYRAYGLEPFLVKQVSSAPDIAHYTRDLVFA
ncbi:hypothetical protein ACF3NX_12695 [Acetobacter orientalis]|uniref:hypothetical protein n=1 Tax=Acetobacter orientalis TaxID=146474 RepID=UPI003863AE4B